MDIKEIANKIKTHGGNLYLVGGAVRNIILGIPPKDYDYCITGLSSEEFINIFPEAIIRGKDFPVFDLYGNEFALARKERKISSGHNGFEMLTDKSITIEDDLIRRDITINSIAIDVLTDEIIDPFDGRKDIGNKIIRATSNAFSEDPLRVYRAARFAAEYSFSIEPATLELMHSLKDELSTLSAERVFVEFRKAMLSNSPTIFFNSLLKCNCLDVHFPELQGMIGLEQPIKYHPEGDVYNHTMEVLERTALITNDELIRFAALVHDFGKLASPKEMLPHHYNHEGKGETYILEFCHRLKMPTSYKKAGLQADKEHMLAGKYNDLRASTKVDFLVRNAKMILGLDGIEIIANTDKVLSEKIKFAEIGKEMLSKVNGKTINISELDYIKGNEKIRQARIEWIKK